FGMVDWAAVDVGWVVGCGRGGKPGGGVGVGGWAAGQDIGILGDMPGNLKICKVLHEVQVCVWRMSMAVEGRRLSRTGEWHLEAIGRENVKKLGVVKLTTMVTLEPTNVTFKLVFNIRPKMDKFIEYFRFMAKRVNP
ncbi:hypothetical protein Tco_0993754, partial [Tanacetum coccineum]